MANFKLYQPPQWKLNLKDSVSIFRILFLVPLFLILGLSISFNQINRKLIFYAAQVDNSQYTLSALSDLSTVLHETNFNIVAHNAYGNKTNRDLAQTNAALIPALVHRLDSLTSTDLNQKEVVAQIHQGIAELYGFSPTDPIPDMSFFSGPGKLPIPNTIVMRKVYEIIEDFKHHTTEIMNSRMENRNNYQTKLFRYNWMLMLASIAFMASIFYLLDGKLLQNRKYRAELENKIENLNRSNSELEQFAYSASHDLQEPLRKMKSFSDRLLQKHADELKPESRVLLDKISSSAGRMQQLIHDLLAFSQLMRTQTDKISVSLNKVLREVQSNLSLVISEKNATITSDDLPTVNVYPSQMVQLFQNLIENSLKYAKPDLAPAIGISYSVVKGSDIENSMPAHTLLDFHNITFTDNGIGFDETFSEKVFALFQRLHGREDYKGTGIGLAICKRVVTNHNGYITVKSIEGLGTSFSIFLPVDDTFDQPV
ncbi:MAG: ATP-binding protein [Spirosomataceae bacterium]